MSGGGGPYFTTLMGRQRNFRNKSSASSAISDDDGVNDAIIHPPQLKVSNSKVGKDQRSSTQPQPQRQLDESRKQQSKTTALLSFEEDDDVGNSTIGSSLAPKVRPTAPQTARPGPRQLPPAATQRSAPGEYSIEKLQQLRQATKQLPGRPVKHPSSSGGALKISGSFKATGGGGGPSDDRYCDPPKVEPRRDPDKQRREIRVPLSAAPVLTPSVASSTSANIGRNPKQFSQPRVAAATQMTAPMQPPADRSKRSEHRSSAAAFNIPNSDAIRRAREKRERLRSAHLAPDYIPLGGAAALTSGNNVEALPLNGAKAEGLSPMKGSSTSGDSDSADEGEGGDSRMLFVGGDPSTPAQPEARGGSSRQSIGGPGRAVLPPAEHQGEESEEEEDEWVQQQLRKAGAARPTALPPINGRQPADSEHPSFGAFSHSSSAALLCSKTPAASAASEGVAVIQSLQDGLRHLEVKRTTLEQQRLQAEQKLEHSLQSVESHRGEIVSASEKYTSAQEMRSYIADTCDMLQAKTAILEVLEERLRDASASTAAASALAHKVDANEQLKVAEAAVAAAAGVLSRGGALPAATAAAERAVTTAEADLLTALPESIDEFGRDGNMEARQAIAERLAKHKAALGPPSTNASAPVVKMESDPVATPVLSSEYARYQRERQKILHAAGTVFADASEAFSSISALRDRLDSWREEQPTAYRDSYMGMSAPALFAPFVRLQLLKWEPLQGGNTDFETQEWHRLLFDFGGGGGAEETDVVPELVRSLVAPIVLHTALKVWDPACTESTTALKGSLEALLVYCDMPDPAMKESIAAVEQRLSDSIRSTTLPRWAPHALQASPQAAAYMTAAYARILVLLSATASLEQLLSPDIISDLVVRHLLLQQILPYLQSYCFDVSKALDLTEQLLTHMPRSWIDGLLPSAAAPLQKFLLDLQSRIINARRPDAANIKRISRLCEALKAS